MTPGRGRIVRDGPSMTSLTLSSLPTLPACGMVAQGARGRIVRRERLEISEERSGILAVARQQAQELMQQAQRDAEEVRREAEQRGVADGAAKLAAAWLNLERREATLDVESTERTIAIARLLAERLLGKSLELDPELIADMAKEAMVHLWRSHRVVIHAHPHDVPMLTKHVTTFGMPPERIEIRADDSRQRGSLRFMSDLGELDGELAPQLDRLVEVIRQELGNRIYP
ncbi:MAG TPA: FliH/SctL family protein [Polyangiaceae bacterium]|nr:MAG: flagellar assembly protein H [Deltaproteobacteria bacterium ADurb.Bin207]HNS95457.1 FliH/SctL family protein [Polyangiaceae bacterium]HNZ20603.1 FliH/SctL family protein [Polyangiaceae bacterium]HOD20781.1 FliH/SctL family protein [Polyangiaceae bacterium]HOE47201.1 FliH/SctL family protein [Polyangiaceae bacterium]